MNEQQIEVVLRAVILDTLNLVETDLKLDSSLDVDDDQAMEMLLGVEEAFETEIPDSAVKKWHTLRHIVYWIYFHGV